MSLWAAITAGTHRPFLSLPHAPVSYPDENCAAIYAGFGQPKDPQAEFARYLDHSMGVNTIQPYLNSTAIAQQSGKPFIMFETNTASCGGFRGISNSFASALWGLDYGLQMVYSNFTHALVHVGGQNVFYNVSLWQIYNVLVLLTSLFT